MVCTLLATGLAKAQEDSAPPSPVIQAIENQRGEENAERFSGQFSNEASRFDIGTDLYSPPDFEGGLIIFGKNVAMKIGGTVKADFIYDFYPIDSTDSFVTTSIPVGAAPRTNARYHARQTRMSSDTRWKADERNIRIFVEGDFFSDGDRFRLRHAYGESGPLLVGRTWTTFTDVAAAPSTLDFEGSVSSVNRRQAQARWTQSIFGHDDLTYALSVEDARFIIELPPGVSAEPRKPSPDFVARVRIEKDWGRFQIANLYRVVGVQPTGNSIPLLGADMRTAPAWGFNFTGVVLLSQSTKSYFQTVFGNGIGSYRSLPDAAPTSAASVGTLPIFGWMVGLTHQWRDDLSSNFTYAENSLENTSFQLDSDVSRTTYLAANLIWQPYDRTKVGIEYLYGLRENTDLAIGTAHRVQVSFIFDLP